MFMRQETQLLLEKLNLKTSLAFGGNLLKNSNAKVQRPISTRRAMHVVLRSSLLKGSRSLLVSKNAKAVDHIISCQAQKHGVKTYQLAKAHNHIHLVLLARTRQGFISFLRAVCGLVVRLLLGAQRGNPFGKNFWDQRPWTRIISWGKEFVGVSKYLEQNLLEAFGFIPYQPRGVRFNSG